MSFQPKSQSRGSGSAFGTHSAPVPWGEFESKMQELRQLRGSFAWVGTKSGDKPLQVRQKVFGYTRNGVHFMASAKGNMNKVTASGLLPIKLFVKITVPSACGQVVGLDDVESVAQSVLTFVILEFMKNHHEFFKRGTIPYYYDMKIVIVDSSQNGDSVMLEVGFDGNTPEDLSQSLHDSISEIGAIESLVDDSLGPGDWGH